MELHAAVLAALIDRRHPLSWGANASDQMCRKPANWPTESSTGNTNRTYQRKQGQEREEALQPSLRGAADAPAPGLVSKLSAPPSKSSGAIVVARARPLPVHPLAFHQPPRTVLGASPKARLWRSPLAPQAQREGCERDLGRRSMVNPVYAESQL